MALKSKTSLTIDKPDLFAPAFTREAIDNAYGAIVDFSEVADTNIESSASFRYDPPGSALRSSQQINIDYSKFQNHTFFNSAEVNVNVAFSKIINEFPFDGTKSKVSDFLDKLTGFEKYVFDRFPKNTGYLFFDSALSSHIVVSDYAGSTVSALSADVSGRNVLDPVNKSMTIELLLYVPPLANEAQVICQKLSGTNSGMTLSLMNDTGTDIAYALFTVASGSIFLNVSASITKGEFNHVVASLDRTSTTGKAFIYVNENLAGESNKSSDFGLIDFKTSDFIIGSGSYFLTASAGGVEPRTTLSGALDELRVFHSLRNTDNQKEYARKAIFASDDLVLYYKFNEPTGTLGQTTTDTFNSIVLDSSGNSLHSYISGFDFSLRSTGSIAVPMTHEKLNLSPVLFPQHADVTALNTLLLVSASEYDSVNPNLITRLVPAHYLLEGRNLEGLEDSLGTIGDGGTNDSLPGTYALGSSQLFSMLLYTYAKYYDELKIFIDAFSKTLHVNYDEKETVPDNFLPLVAEYYGFKIPGFFSNSSIAQFIDAENLTHDISTSEYSLRYVQNQLLRRILSSMRDVVSSKGTVHSLKSMFRAMGIDPDNSVRIREFGGPSQSTLDGLRERKTDVSTMLYMTASNSFVTSQYLSGAKVEPESSYPASSAPHVKSSVTFTTIGGATSAIDAYVSPNSNDGLFTSGSWTYEAVYRFPVNNTLTSTTQSLVRMNVTGSEITTATGGLVANLVAISQSNITNPGIVRLYLRPGYEQTEALSPTLTLEVTGANVFDGSRWHASFGRTRNDDPKLNSTVSSSYFLRVEKFEPDYDRFVATTSSYFVESTSPVSNSLQSISSSFNTLGQYLTIGSQSYGTGTAAAGYRLLNATDIVDAEARHVVFDGLVGHMRFWSRKLTESELIEHARNFRSLGSSDPTTNFNYVTAKSGSFERLRLDVSTDQPAEDRVAAADGTLRIFDFSQNELHMVATGLEPSATVIRAETFVVDHLSTIIDEASTNQKTRVRSFLDKANVDENPASRVAPLYELARSEKPVDDVRLSIDFSVVDALNRDIINMLSTLDTFNGALGSPELMFSQDYPEIETLRDVYFNRLQGNLNVRSFYEFFAWIDTSIGMLIAQLIPSKTKFLGMNFVVENHLLERGKIEYRNTGQYIGEDKRIDTGKILLQQIVGTLRKY